MKIKETRAYINPPEKVKQRNIAVLSYFGKDILVQGHGKSVFYFDFIFLHQKPLFSNNTLW